MNIRHLTRDLVIVATAALIYSASAVGQGQAMTVQTGRVVAQQAVNIDTGGAAGKGAAVGGLVGLAATSSGRSSSRRARNAMLGAGVGAAIGSSQRSTVRGMQYTVELSPGNSIVVITDQTEIRVGDCVNVEQAGPGTANVRRVSSWLCDQKTANVVDNDVDAFLAEAADRCLAAKDGLLEAETDAQVDAAIARVHILCDD